MTTDRNTADAYVPAPEQRISMPEQAAAWYRAMIDLDRASRPSVDPALAELVRTHASNLNGCAFCLDMHTTDARKNGEQEHRLYALPAWRETPYYTARERAALALTEAITLITRGHVPDEVYDEAAEHFDQQELAQLIAVIISINSWNRIAITTRMSPAPKQS
ncbi:carboxymuconolactone decarboxylase family protein [Kitasatospora sp. MAP5-34]|uniref:carboxymuconolactone decarboxylase family protein n=1 Tax=Kitasatospora sp. MAP5-34 TaxID=3035102 RepID=UPI0024749EDE|nr:carboxymuconolactone decarboxylase family protein [Kitasatospora sp. MAP5-34]MDH6578751.1 AhpD family alkylhydroperoxidase [Kitasatospora sp. MAP5-34]